MQTSVFIARLVGPVMLVVAIALLINRRMFFAMAEDFMASRPLMFLNGLLAMPAGLAIVLTHNVWTADWRVLITLFGWLTAIGGAVRLLAPDYVVQTGRTVMKARYFPIVATAIWGALGLIFCFFGYFR
jgi:hypothetical protein